ncbi:DUF3052 domain-containing protein [Frankia sp. CcI49]|uniref:hypothetical protein n=1 Tax=unclassified Frankia TaxID=2632575 RepID=UPI0006CA5694|nr:MULTISPECIES: hypothetical protein [unclassified Frankia]KPM55373.1 hypothetical protein ACG83_08270 [Frankia sp. R43]ONH52363.1 DUF3052 domain-containing protein [Frankia sp. CcI49]
MPAAGYSGTPLARKLGVRADSRLVLAAAPPGWTVPDLPGGVEYSSVARLDDLVPGPVDVCVAFCREARDVRQAADSFRECVRPAGALWFGWPRRAAGHRSDVTENLIREVVLPLGLVDVKVAAMDADWSGLKVVWRKERR